MASCSTQESSTSASAAFDPSTHPFLVLDKTIFTNHFSCVISPTFSVLVNTTLRRETFTGCVQERDPDFLFCKCGDSSAQSSGSLPSNAVKEAPVDASSREMQPPLCRKLPQQRR